MCGKPLIWLASDVVTVRMFAVAPADQRACFEEGRGRNGECGMRSKRLPVYAGVMLAVAALPITTATGQCVGPYLHLEDPHASHPVSITATTVTVEGRAFARGCTDDTANQRTLGCTAPEPEPVDVPEKDVTLTLEQDGRSWMLGTEDAGTSAQDRLGHITWTVRLPTEVEPGRARLIAPNADPLPIRIVR